MIASPPRRRILVALHPSDEQNEALDWAAALADELGGDLMGLFVEDQALFDLCGLEAVEVVRSTGAARRLDLSELERQLRATAGAARNRVSRAAAARRVTWSFEIRRGNAGEAVFEATERAQLVVASRGSFGPWRLSSGPRVGPVVVLLDRGPGEAATLDAAVRAARRVSAPMVGLLVGERAAGERAALDEVAQRAGVGLELRTVGSEPDRIVRELAAAAPRLFVLDARGAASVRGLLARYVAAAASEAILIGVV